MVGDRFISLLCIYKFFLEVFQSNGTEYSMKKYQVPTLDTLIMLKLDAIPGVMPLLEVFTFKYTMLGCIRASRMPALLVGTLQSTRTCVHVGGRIQPAFPARSLVVVAAASKKNVNLDKKYQPTLSASEKKNLRTKSQQLAKQLVTVNLGAKGLTLPFFSGLYTSLLSNQLVKVRMGCTREEKQELTEHICDILDCACVHSIGTTVVLYRAKGLPKPLKLQNMERVENSAHTEEDDEDNADGMENDGPSSPSSPPPPPEFTVLS